MEYRKLGDSDLSVSRICMGCMGFGEVGGGRRTWTVDEEASRGIIRRGLLKALPTCAVIRQQSAMEIL